MDKYVVTLSRQFASMGRTIAQHMSEELNIEFYDRDIVEDAAKRMGVTVSDVGENEETAGSVFGNMKYPFGLGLVSTNREIFEVESNIIRDIAGRDESCIIVGRCADYVLRDLPDCLHIHVYASAEHRIKNCVDFLGMDEKDARRVLPQMDKSRSLYRFRYCEDVKDVFDGRDIMIDSGTFGPEKTADILCGVVRSVFG